MSATKAEIMATIRASRSQANPKAKALADLRPLHHPPMKTDEDLCAFAAAFAVACWIADASGLTDLVALLF